MDRNGLMNRLVPGIEASAEQGEKIMHQFLRRMSRLSIAPEPVKLVAETVHASTASITVAGRVVCFLSVVDELLFIERPEKMLTINVCHLLISVCHVEHRR